jgi:hypothetical protein
MRYSYDLVMKRNGVSVSRGVGVVGVWISRGVGVMGCGCRGVWVSWVLGVEEQSPPVVHKQVQGSRA